MQKYPQINIRVDPDFLKRLDQWRKTQDDLPGRPEAVRRIVEQALSEPSSKKKPRLKDA